MFSIISLVTPPGAEPVTVAQAKQHTRIDNDADDALVGTYITAARTWIEIYLSRCLVSQQLLWTLGQDMANGYPMVSVPLSVLVLPQWFSWRQISRGPLTLPRQPVVSVDSVAYGQWGAIDTVLVANTDYAADIGAGRLLLNAWNEIYPSDHIAVKFTAGYGAPAAVPAPISQAILLLTAYFFENRGDVPAEPPTAVGMLLTPYRQISFG